MLAAQAHAECVAGRARTRSARATRRVAIVDDDADACAMLVELLEHHGWQASSFTRPTDAVAAIVADPPDVVLLDLRLPEMSGHDVARELRVRAELGGLVIVATSGETPTITDAFDDYLLKPLDLAELPRLLSRLIDVRTSGERAR